MSKEGNVIELAGSKKNPKIFMSYSWSSPEHENFVVELAKRLSSDGVEVVLDKWALKEGQDKYAFMEQMVTDSSIDRVLIISDKEYAKKADKRKGGVGTESQIISSEIYNKVEQIKFIPIVSELGEDGVPHLPAFLKSRIYIDLSSDKIFLDEYEKLLRCIYGKPANPKPVIGTPPSYITDESPLVVITTHKFGSFKQSILQGKANGLGLFIDFLEGLESIYPGMLIESENRDLFDEFVVESIREFKPYRDQFIEAVKIIAQHNKENEYYEELFNFLEKVLPYNDCPKGVASYNDGSFDNYKFINQELFLYAVAILIKYKKFEQLNILLGRRYYVNSNGSRRLGTFAEFHGYITSLNEWRNSRLKLGRTSITADLIKDRADSNVVSFDDIMEADIILCIRSLLLDNKEWGGWFPNTAVYGRSKTTEIFFRAKEKRGFEALKKILNISSKQELLDKWAKFDLSAYRAGRWSIDFSSIMNMNELDTL